MQINDLMRELARLFPHQFATHEQAEAWAKVYRSALREGLDLDDAFRSCMASWTKKDAPKPADIAAHMRRKHKTSSGYSTGAQIAYAYDNVERVAGEILEQAVFDGLARCSSCSTRFPDCRCSAWHMAWERALMWLQREFQIQHGVSRDNPHPKHLTQKDLRYIATDRTAPPIRSAGTFAPLGPAHVPMPNSRFRDDPEPPVDEEPSGPEDGAQNGEASPRASQGDTEAIPEEPDLEKDLAATDDEEERLRIKAEDETFKRDFLGEEDMPFG